jgi:DnaJ-class molecular chaperone
VEQHTQSSTTKATDEQDAYGCIGTRYECQCCSGTGKEWDETCVMCGGWGWINLPITKDVE